MNDIINNIILILVAEGGLLGILGHMEQECGGTGRLHTSTKADDAVVTRYLGRLENNR